MTIMYVPGAYCLQCEKPCEVVRLHDGKGRWCEARCHGETERVAFTPEPGQVFNVFNKKAAADPAAAQQTRAA